MDEHSNKHEKKAPSEFEDDSDLNDENKDSSSDKKAAEQEKKEVKKTDLASFFTSSSKQETKKAEINSESTSKQPEEIEESVEFEDNLSEQEVQEATLAIVDARTQEVSEDLEQADSDSPEEFEAVANAVFLESLQDLVTQETEVTPELLDKAFIEALEDLALTEDNDLPETDEIERVIDNDSSDMPPSESLDEPDEDADDISTIPAVPAPPVPPIPTLPVGPPNPPNTPFTPIPSAPVAHNYYTQPTQQNMLQHSPNSQPVIVQEIHNHRSDLLLGVIVGYIIGRRGGRKRIEKKLQPKIDNLEEQIQTLQDAILEKEIRIRDIARAHAIKSYGKSSIESSETTTITTTEILERRVLRKQVSESLRRREELSKMPGVEKMGKFSLPALKVFHERRLPDGTETSPIRVQVEVMTTEQLLEKVDGLIIHELRVTKMFHRSRLSVEALRQITKEYLRSGPYEKTFFHELQPDPKHIETLTKQVIEKNTVHAVDETLKSQFAENPARNNDSTFIDSQKKKSDAIKAQKMQKQLVVSGVMAGIVLAAIWVAFMLAR